MKKLSFFIFILFGSVGLGQDLTQIVRGTVVDGDNGIPLESAVVMIPGTEPLIGATTDVNGKFRFEAVPLGRINLLVTFIGYENKSLPNIIVNSGKEVVLEIAMRESVEKMDEVVVTTTDKKKGRALNEMALVSARSVSLEEAKRFAGGWDDPSRILSNFAGVTNSQNGENDIIVRGNSPKYIQWRLEGMDIDNPTHFGDQNSVKGGISALNNNLLSTSDFYTGAFSPEYGKVLSGVYDVKLRSGNNEKFEMAAGLGALGIDLTLEGPFKKGYGGSYLVNYRYSTAGLMSDLGLVDLDGALSFQDMTFKFDFPTEKWGTFSLFGLGGLSSFSYVDVQPDLQSTPGEAGAQSDISEDYDKDNLQFNTGLSHTINIGENSFLKTSFSYSGNGIYEDIFQNKDSVPDRKQSYFSRLEKNGYQAAITYSNKLNAKHRIQLGSKYSVFNYDYTQRISPVFAGNGFDTLVDFTEDIGTLRNFISWKYRLNDDITMVAGIHNMNVLYNSKSTIEPRVALNFRLSGTSSINAGYGKHSTMESAHNYFAKVAQPNGSLIELNKDLDLLKAHHFVLGYETRLSQNMLAKVETYYQDLYDIPVENNNASYYSTLVEGSDFRYVDLVNEGTGKNYGVELTLERFLANNYYYLINTSVFDSKYTALDGIERNTPYSGNYLINALFGKEFVDLGRKRNQTLAINGKAFFGGGQKYIPLLRDAQGNLAVDVENNNYYDFNKAFQDKLDNIFQMTLSASYKFNRPEATHEIFINLDNVSNSRGKISEYYDEKETNSIGYVTQFGFFPNLIYRVYF